MGSPCLGRAARRQVETRFDIGIIESFEKIQEQRSAGKVNGESAC